MMHPLGEANNTFILTGGTTGKIGSFGWTRAHGRRRHDGIDMMASMGQPVFAAHGGWVKDAGFQRNHQGKRENKGYGLRVYVKSQALSVETVYAHLSGIAVKTSTYVVEGQLLGWVGRTGNITDERTHLHFGVRLDGEWIDPLEWIDGEHGRNTA